MAKPPPTLVKGQGKDIYGDDYEWPDNLYKETEDMSRQSFFVYTLSYLRDVHQNHEKLEGVDLPIGTSSEDQRVRSRSVTATSTLKRTYTPTDVKSIINNEKNRKILEKYYESFKPENMTQTNQTLDSLISVAEESGLTDPIELEEFDDEFQKRELVYSVMKDDARKRVVLVFRGTTNALAFASDWGSNTQLWKTKVALPKSLEDKLPRNKQNKLYLHNGFYNYLFMKTVYEDDAEGTKKYDQVLADVKAVLSQHPGYKLYVTGHSLGGALSTLASFFLSCEEDIPKPVSCINFAAPRTGDRLFLDAVQHQEKTRQLRICRVSNEGDSIAFVNSLNYAHVGFQIKLFKARYCATKAANPIVHYPNLKASEWDWLKISWRNSIVNSINLTYDHGDYRERVTEAKEYLETLCLNDMYADKFLVGFDITE